MMALAVHCYWTCERRLGGETILRRTYRTWTAQGISAHRANQCGSYHLSKSPLSSLTTARSSQPTAENPPPPRLGKSQWMPKISPRVKKVHLPLSITPLTLLSPFSSSSTLTSTAIVHLRPISSPCSTANTYCCWLLFCPSSALMSTSAVAAARSSGSWIEAFCLVGVAEALDVESVRAR